MPGIKLLKVLRKPQKLLAFQWLNGYVLQDSWKRSEYKNKLPDSARGLVDLFHYEKVSWQVTWKSRAVISKATVYPPI